MSTSFSRDVGAEVPVDLTGSQGDVKVVKRKLFWGADGETFDITADTPLPVSASVNIGNVTLGEVNQGSPNTIPNAWPVLPTDGTNSQAYTASGEAKVSITGTISLPTGASTAAKQDTGNTSLAAIDAKITAVDTGAVVVSSSALPSGAAISSKQDTGNTSLASIDLKLTTTNSDLSTLDTDLLAFKSANHTDLAAVEGKQDTGNASLASIDSKITAVNTGAVVISASALPSGAAISSKQDTGNTSLSSIDGKMHSYDGDSGAGTETLQGVMLRASGNGGSTEVGTSSAPLRTDPTGSTPQPASQSGTWNITNVSGTVTLPTGASTAARQDTLDTDLLAFKTSNHTDLTGGGQKAQVVDGSGNVLPSGDTVARGIFTKIGDGTDTLNITASGEAQVLVTPLTNSSVVKVQLQDNAGTAVTVAQKAMSASLPVVIASDQSAVTVSQSTTGTPTLTQVSVTSTNTSVLASNGNRKKFTLFNEGAGTAYVAYGATATTSAYSFQMKPNAYYECQIPIFTGALSAITSTGTAALKITELT